MKPARILMLVVVGVIVALAGLAQLLAESGKTWLGVLMLISAVPLFVISGREVANSRKR